MSRSRLPKDAHSAVEYIVARSRVRNAAIDITGMLLFTGVSFAQLVEGLAAAIAALRRSIRADERHDDLIDLLPPVTSINGQTAQPLVAPIG